MPATYTPLRYPGGKAKLGPFLAALFKANRLIDGEYAEPYAGGAGAGLFLLFRGYATHLHLNDIDRGVVAFWRAVLTHNERFAKRIQRVPLTVDEWDRQRATYRTEAMGFDLGFAFFYLNRTNRSGIMNGGIIGGRAQQSEWGIDARFAREDLARRVRAIGQLRKRVSVTRLDAIDFAMNVKPLRSKKMFTYFDPPYFAAGRQLYTNFYTADDHAAIAKHLSTTKNKWLLTYDDCPQIRKLYKECKILKSELSYSAREVRRGSEIVVVPDGVRLPPNLSRRPCDGRPGFELVK
jgi:DNA adenine methylase